MVDTMTMTTSNTGTTPALAPADAVLRQGFKYGNKFMLLMWRLGLQRWGMRNPYSGYIMVLTHTGRKSGRLRRTPVNYAEIDGDLFCVAGFGAAADWYRNLLKTPAVEVWLPDGSWWAGMAEDVTALPDAQRLPLVRQVLINSGFAARLAGINPRTQPDAELAAATQEYKLVRIRRTVPRTGGGGPGDLAWLWMVATLGLGLAWLGRSRSINGNRNQPGWIQPDRKKEQEEPVN
jgi:deazaflavin-dependent oxidoreductase (nitroreductase family)